MSTLKQPSDLAQEPCEATQQDRDNQAICSARRQFLGRAAGAAGSLALGWSATRPAAAQNDQSNATDVVVKLNEKRHEGLNKVGGSEVIDSAGGKVIVAHPDEATFVACSAICTHRGGQLFYEHDSKQFVCPAHGARFDLSGKVVKGPVRTPLQSYATDPAIIVGVKPLG